MEYLLISIILIAILIFTMRKNRKSSRILFLKNYEYHSLLKRKIKNKYEHLTEEELDKVFLALSDYFYICNKANNTPVSMPSLVVDIAWHEFILMTKEYEEFCKKAFGKFLHHTPTEAMKTKTKATEGLKRAWSLACQKEEINSKKPHKLPLLFAIDSMLNIEDGYKYSLDCNSTLTTPGNYCASHIGCSGGCSSGSSCTSSCGSSCSGD